MDDPYILGAMCAAYLLTAPRAAMSRLRICQHVCPAGPGCQPVYS